MYYRFIKFSQKLNFGEQNKFFAGMNFFFGEYGTYEFNCNYRQSLVTDQENFTPISKPIAVNDRRLDQFLSWDATFELKFFDSISTEPTDPTRFYLGSTVIFEAIWKQKFSDKFPVEFHVSKCTIKDKALNAAFDVIKDGCGADILWTALLSDTPYQKETLSWSFRSFQFQRDQVNAELALDCEISFCLVDDRIGGTCLSSEQDGACVEGYTKPAFVTTVSLP